MLLFTCGEKRNWQSFKKSQNIMSMIVAQVGLVRSWLRRLSLTKRTQLKFVKIAITNLGFSKASSYDYIHMMALRNCEPEL